jgi:ABC-type branched-subunit amino acid transport system substrate-binding protein
MQMRRVWMVALLGLGLVAAACSSSSKSSSSTHATSAGKTAGTTAGSTGAAPSGTPIKLGVMTAVQTNAVSQPWIPQAARIGAAAVNAAGGIMGRPVQIDFCDDHYTPQGAALCAQKLLVQDKVFMMVGDDGTQEAALIPTLSSANTISWASYGASLQSLMSSRVYILAPSEASYWVIPQMLPATTKHAAYIFPDVAIANAAEKATVPFFPKTVQITPVSVPLTEANLQPACLQVKQSGADTAIVAMNPGQVATLIQTCNQIGLTSTLWVIPSLQMTDQVLQTVTQLHQPNLAVLSYGGNAVPDFAADVAKYGPQVGGITNTIADDAVGAWLGVKLLAQIVPQVGSVDATKVKAWLDQQTAFQTDGATPPINFTATPISALPRLKNLSATKGVIQNNQAVVTNPTPFVIHMP